MADLALDPPQMSNLLSNFEYCAQTQLLIIASPSSPCLSANSRAFSCCSRLEIGVETMPITATSQRVPAACPLHCSSYRAAKFAPRSRSNAKGPHRGASGGRMRAAPAVSTETEEDTYTWTGEDEFDKLKDRVDAPPLPLPVIREAKRVALVRHGQSTWNAQGRVQGSSDISYLTKKGESQAETTRQMVGLHPALVQKGPHGCP